MHTVRLPTVRVVVPATRCQYWGRIPSPIPIPYTHPWTNTPPKGTWDPAYPHPLEGTWDQAYLLSPRRDLAPPSCGHNDICENIIFPQLLLWAVNRLIFK